MDSSEQVEKTAGQPADEVQSFRHKIAVEALSLLEHLVAEHNKRVKKIAQRCKISIAPATLKTIRTWSSDRILEDGSYDLEHPQWYAEVEIVGQQAKISGWQILGSLTSTDCGFLLSPIGSGVDLSSYKDRGGQCDHCKTARARSVTYILRSGGDIKLVGSQCLKDFTGHLTPAAMAMYADSLIRFDREISDMEDGDDGEGRHHGGGCRLRSAVSLLEYLGYVAQQIRKCGWVSKTKAQNSSERATAPEAWLALQQIQEYKQAIERAREGKTEEQLKETARSILALYSTDGQIDPAKLGGLTSEQVLATEAGVRASARQEAESNAAKLTEDMEQRMPTSADRAKAAEDSDLVAEVFAAKAERDDYEDRLLSVIGQGFAFERNIGLAASICAAADRIRRDRVKEQVRALEKDEWFGVVGKRETFVLNCVYTQSIDGAFGPSTLHIFLDKDGRKAKWFSTNEKLDKGFYEIKGTVKKHETYEGRKIVQLSRCKVVQKLSDEAARCPF